MNSINIMRGLIIFISILFFSCDNEPVDQQPSTPNVATTCSIPINVTVTRSTNVSMATLLWTRNGDQNSWQVQYGNSGFVLGTGTTVFSNTPSKIVTGLLATVGYDFYVRSQCSDNQYGDWVGPIAVSAVGEIATANYWPRAVQNQWIFSVDNINEQPWRIVGTDVLDGNTYYTFQPIDGQPQRRIRKSVVGDYFDRYDDYAATNTTISGNETIILKDYLSVNSNWTENYLQTTTTLGLPPQVLDVQIVSRIVEREASVTVPAGTFNNVILVERVKTISGLNFPAKITTTTYWFAKDRGPIQIETVTDTETTVEKLTAYILY